MLIFLILHQFIVLSFYCCLILILLILHQFSVLSFYCCLMLIFLADTRISYFRGN
jgi:hypothetical protein